MHCQLWYMRVRLQLTKNATNSQNTHKNIKTTPQSSGCHRKSPQTRHLLGSLSSQLLGCGTDEEKLQYSKKHKKCTKSTPQHQTNLIWLSRIVIKSIYQKARSHTESYEQIKKTLILQLQLNLPNTSHRQIQVWQLIYYNCSIFLLHEKQL